MWQIAGYSALSVAIICLIITVLSPVFNSSQEPFSIDANSIAVGHSATFNIVPAIPSDSETKNEEERALEELKRIAVKCKSDGSRPNMTEVRTTLEDLSQKLRTNSESTD